MVIYFISTVRIEIEKNDEKRNIGREQGYEAYDI